MRKWRGGRLLSLLACGLLAGVGVADSFKRSAYSGTFDYLSLATTLLQNPYSFNLAVILIFFEFIMVVLTLTPKTYEPLQVD
jgi:hypothetical protein